MKAWKGTALLLAGTACMPSVMRPHRPVPGDGELSTVACVTVAEGETLYRLAMRLGTTPEALGQANGISDPRDLKMGQRLCAPEGAMAGPRPAPPALGLSQGRFAWPLRGVLYGRFGKRGDEHHDGIDLAAPLGTPVRAAASGNVMFAGEKRGYGKLILVEHEAPWVTLYAHNHELRVKEGARVQAGDVIATVGESGRTTGPHLHFEVRQGGKPVDPLPLLGPLPRSEGPSATAAVRRQTMRRVPASQMRPAGWR
ncbi:MAG: M23 family metallopeptidase [Myxococcaceae bacterium]